MSESVNAEIGKSDLSGARWRKSSYSNATSNCVELATNLPGVVAVRDSKDRDGAVLAFGAGAWREFAGHVKSGWFDLR